MAVTEQTPFNAYVANGVTTSFPFAYLALLATDLIVEVTDPAGTAATKEYPTDYTVTGVGENAGGNVVFAVAPANASRVLILRSTALERQTDYQNNGDLLAGTVNRDFDRLWLALQEATAGGRSSLSSLRVPEARGVPALPTAAARASKLLAFDSSGDPVVMEATSGSALDLALSLISSAGAAMIGWIQAGAGAVRRLLQDKVREAPISVEDFRSSGFTDQQALEAWRDAINLRQIAGDAAGFGGAPDALIPDRTYTLTADFTMPNGRILCRGKIVTGAFKVKFVNPRRTYCEGLTAETVLLSGGYFSTWVDLKATTVTIDGYATGYGFFWNTIKDSLCDIVIDLSKWSVNQNLFQGGRGRVQTKGTTGSLLDGHMNNTVNWDFTSVNGGYMHDSSVVQSSTAINAYVEATPKTVVGDGVTTVFSFPFRADSDASVSVYKTVGGVISYLVLGVGFTISRNADQINNPGGTVTLAGAALVAPDSVTMNAPVNIKGPVNILGLQGDVLGPPEIGRRNHLLFTGDVSERCRADFFPISGTNLIEGGEWDWLDLDASGNIKPVGFFANPHFQASTVTDATEPFGMGQAYGGTFTQEFSIFRLTLPAIPGGKFGLVLAYKGDDFNQVSVNRGGGDETYYGTTGVDIDGTWKLYRLSGRANTATTTYVDFFITTGPGVQPAATIHVGGCVVTPEKVVPMPSAKRLRRLSTGELQAFGYGVAQLSSRNTFTKAQVVTPVALTDAATIATDASLSNVFTVTLGANRAMGAPTNLAAGGTYTWHIGTGAGPYGITSWDAVFDWGAAGAPTLTATASKFDMVSGQYVGGKLRMGALLKGYS